MASTKKWTYPETKREDVEEEFFGVKVKDPYRWLEEADATQTAEWVKKQNEVTAAVLSECKDKEKIFSRLKELQNYPKYSAPMKKGSKYFFWKNSGLQNQDVLYIQDTLDGPEREFLDPAKIREDGTASIGVYRFSKNGEKLAYGVNFSGSDWSTIYVKDVLTGAQLSDELQWVKFSGISWTHDHKGFFYCRYNPTEGGTKDSNSLKNQRVYYHTVGTPQLEDKLIFAVPTQPSWMFGCEVSQDGKYLILSISHSTQRVNRLYYLLLDNLQFDAEGIAIPVKLIDDFDAMYDYITNDGTLFYFMTNKNSPKCKLITIDIAAPDVRKDVIGESSEVLQWVTCINDQFVVCYMQDVKEVMYLYDMKGTQLLKFPLPAAGTIVSISGEREDSEMFYHFVSFLYPGSIYHYDFKNSKSTVFKEIKVPGFNPEEFVTEQIFYESHDKTKIPMFILKHKNTQLDGNNPCVLYGYGGFNISLTPGFSVSRIIWMSCYRGVYAIANIRGGDEYGEEWHEGGILLKKENCFEDFRAAAVTLCDMKLTNADKLAIMGGSNGGLLVSACINRNPSQYKCGIAQVPVTDMLRYHKWTIGYAWASDYGTADDEQHFKNLIRYSPLHTVKKGTQYPALMVTTADHDDRVVPAHSFKYISEVQYQLGNEEYQYNPLVIRIDVKAGHGRGKPLDKVLEELSDTYAFIAHSLGATWQLQ